MEDIIKTDTPATIDLDVKEKSIHFPVRVTMSLRDNNDKFITSVDEHGHIILTPEASDNEFIKAHTEWESDDYVMPTDVETIIIDGDRTKEFTVELTADMLMEVPSENIFADIDAIGQCVIYPQESNMFISASIEDSLNLVTEDAYEEKSEEESKPDIEATIEESIEDAAYSYDEVLNELERITHNFTDTSSEVKCGFEIEKDYGVEILSEHYRNVESKCIGEWFHIIFSDKKELEESLNANKEDIINRFMQGEVTIFSDDVVPENTLHIEELDSDGFEYYYDTESDSMVVVSPRGV